MNVRHLFYEVNAAEYGIKKQHVSEAKNMTSMPMDMNPAIARKLKEIGDAFCIKGPFFRMKRSKWAM